MDRFLKKKRGRKVSERYLKGEIDPDEVLIDAKNLPSYDLDRLEGRLEKPISKRTFLGLGAVFLLILIGFSFKAWNLQITHGFDYEQKSENNRLKKAIVIAERGIITDRKDTPLAWNDPNTEGDFPLRSYIQDPGLGLLLGYISYPLKDSSGFYYQPYFEGKDGVEASFNTKLAGVNGIQITETNAKQQIESENVLEPPQNGATLKLSVDERIQTEMYKDIKALAEKVDFKGGSGAIMDVKTGELLALTSYPEYSPQVLTDGKDKAAISSYNEDNHKPYLNRPVQGLYTPGSIVKPFVALGALTEHVITPDKQILSTGSISIPNPYDKSKPSIFRDWRAQGWVDMRHAISVSSDVYFYEVGGGFQDQKGLGISNLEKYFRLFGLGNETGINFDTEEVGTIPSPEWKKENFGNDPWRVGDTYNTAIGQYGMQVTPLQMVRGIASIANGGYLLKPTVIFNGNEVQTGEKLPIAEENFQVVREGMRLGAQEGTAKALNVDYIKIAGKTGTAELGVTKQRVNSWVEGFFPYDHPRYAFIVQMEQGPRNNLMGASLVMREMFDWMRVNTPEYLKDTAATTTISGD